jgi:fructoselysine-6-P-deglycase FrlB-like protein
MAGTIMSAEMAQQPERLAALLARREETAARIARLLPPSRPDRSSSPAGRRTTRACTAAT